MGREQLRELERSGMYLSVPQGSSMWPMLRSRQNIVEIRRLEGRAKRYDLVLYVRGENQQGVLHRVLRVRDDDYIIAGDNCWRKEYVPREQVVGIAVRFYRGNKWHETTEKAYLRYVHFWTNTFYIRRPFFWARDKAKTVLRRARGVAGRIKRKIIKPGA